MKRAPLNTLSKGKGQTDLISAYTSSSFGITDRLSVNAGLNSQVLTLNNSWTLEPRLGIKWAPTTKSSFALAYGLHSRMEKMDVYFVNSKSTGKESVNKDLDFTKAHHLMLTFGYKLSDNLLLKVEPYAQFLYDVPVIADSSYSVLNRREFYVEEALVNKGKGRNIGVDITLEQYLSRGFYYLVTASVFDSKYNNSKESLLAIQSLIEKKNRRHRPLVTVISQKMTTVRITMAVPLPRYCLLPPTTYRKKTNGMIRRMTTGGVSISAWLPNPNIRS